MHSSRQVSTWDVVQPCGAQNLWWSFWQISHEASIENDSRTQDHSGNKQPFGEASTLLRTLHWKLLQFWLKFLFNFDPSTFEQTFLQLDATWHSRSAVKGLGPVGSIGRLWACGWALYCWHKELKSLNMFELSPAFNFWALDVPQVRHASHGRVHLSYIPAELVWYMFRWHIWNRFAYSCNILPSSMLQEYSRDTGWDWRGEAGGSVKDKDTEDEWRL